MKAQQGRFAEVRRGQRVPGEVRVFEKYIEWWRGNGGGPLLLVGSGGKVKTPR